VLVDDPIDSLELCTRLIHGTVSEVNGNSSLRLRFVDATWELSLVGATGGGLPKYGRTAAATILYRNGGA
jgi:hypothetical protein